MFWIFCIVLFFGGVFGEVFGFFIFFSCFLDCLAFFAKVRKSESPAGRPGTASQTKHKKPSENTVSYE